MAKIESEAEMEPSVQIVGADVRGFGRLSGSFLVKYIMNMKGLWIWLPFIGLLTMLESGSAVAVRYAISSWAEGCSSQASKTYFCAESGLSNWLVPGTLIGLLWIALVVGATMGIRALSWSSALIFLSRGALASHDRGAAALSLVPVTFFDSQPSGRLLARLSDDYEKVLREIPNYLVDILSCTAELIWAVAVVVLGAPVLLPVAVPCAFAYIRLQQIFVVAGRELQRLSKELEAPGWGLFTEGVSAHVGQSIRVHGRRAVFVETLHEHHRRYGRAELASSRVTRWLNMRLKLVSELFALAVALFAVFALSRGYLVVSAAGFLMSLSIGLDATMQWATRALSMLEPALVSVERLAQLGDLKPEHGARMSAQDLLTAPELVSKQHKAQLQKTARGATDLVFDQVTVSYRPDLPPVLKDVSFTVRHGERIGIIGRTGAGKSTIFQALFQMVHLVRGSVRLESRTDSESLVTTDLFEIDAERARSFFTIVPQDPVLFSGSVRYNLDRLGVHDDAVIWTILDQVGLAEVVARLPGGLSYILSEGGGNLSSGERQLLCIARAALRVASKGSEQPCFVLLDEATASVDHRTDARIGAALQRVFSDSTLLVIAHRLETVHSCDRVLAFAGGRLVAQGTPGQVISEITFETGEVPQDLGSWL